MADDLDKRVQHDDVSIASRSNASQSSADASSIGAGDTSVSAAPPTASGSADPADEIPVPPAMSPAEIDERAQAVQAVRGTSGEETLPPADA